jgi:hypothetical protein
MILGILVAVAVGGLGYGVYKHYTAGGTVAAAVLAEVAAVEAEVTSGKLSADAKAAYAAVAARVKAVLAKL